MVLPHEGVELSKAEQAAAELRRSAARAYWQAVPLHVAIDEVRSGYRAAQQIEQSTQHRRASRE